MAAGSSEVEVFCRKVHPKLVGALTLYTGDRLVAEDVAQEALVRAWDKWRSVSRLDHPEAWVLRVAFNLSASHFRRRDAEQRALARRPPDERVSDAERDEALVVRAAVGALPPRERAAIALRYFADLSVDKTADAMKCRPGTVKSLTHSAVAQLRRSLGSSFIDDEELLRDV